MKPKLHIHSDCFKWGGSENMPGIFLQDPTINQSFNVSFSYRYSKEYERGMRKWVPNAGDVTYGLENPIYPLHLPITFLYKISPYFKLIMALGYFSAIVDIVKMTKLFLRIKPDILHINNGGYPGAISCNAAAIAGWIAGVPKITYFICSTTRNPWWLRPMTWMVRRSVTIFISASKHLRDHSGFLRRRDKNTSWNSTWQTISNTIKPQILASRENVRTEIGLPNDEVVFLCMGDLVERKGFYRAIDAIANVNEIGTPRSLLIFGSGPEEQFLRVRASAKKRGVYRIISDRVPSIPPYSIVNACDVLVVPSIGEEDWPNVMLIAMMYGKPIIASNILGFHEMIVHGDNGYLANTEQEFSAIMALLLNDSLRAVVGQRAKERYEQKYRMEKIVGKYLELWNG